MRRLCDDSNCCSQEKSAIVAETSQKLDIFGLNNALHHRFYHQSIPILRRLLALIEGAILASQINIIAIYLKMVAIYFPVLQLNSGEFLELSLLLRSP